MKKCRRGLAILLVMALLAFMCPMSFAAAAADVQETVTTESLETGNPNSTEVNTQEEKKQESEAPDTDWTQRDQISTQELTRVLSLISLTSDSAQVNLSSYTPAELRMVSFANLLQRANKTVSPSASVAWAYAGRDNYSVTGVNQAVDILGDNLYGGEHNLNAIVGSAKQLDTGNVRYGLTVELNEDLEKWLTPTLYTQDANGTRTAISVLDFDYSSGEGTGELWIEVPRKALPYDQQAYLGLAIDSRFNNGNYDSVHVYRGKYTDIGPATEITSQIFGQNMTQANAGYPSTYSSEEDVFTLVLQKGSQIVGHETFYVDVGRTANEVSLHSLTTVDGRTIDALNYQSSYEEQSKTEITTVTLPKGHSASTSYKQRFSYYQLGRENNGAVELAVVGSYDSKEAAAGQSDIKAALFGDGYQANYSGNGVTFSVFADGEVFHQTVRVQEGSVQVEEIPDRPGSDDTYFRVEGAVGQQESGYYVMPYQHDSYHYNGFQTVFLLDPNADLSKLVPDFWTGDQVTMYTTGSSSKETSGVSVHDFSKGPVQYSASSGSKENVKNYWVTFVKKQTGGAKLFVNGLNGSQGSTREIFLNGFYDNKHDIFLANIGDAPLTNLKAELINPQNVKLDSYWTVGEERNNTLAAFTTTQRQDYNSELSNVAKIRLLPNGDGDISGTLRITADGQPPVEIRLTGKAGDPKIVTQTIPAGVKYVPYGTMIQTSNMYDWNRVRFSKVSGSLPQGMTLKPNGEIYGVPKETGTFSFRVRMRNSYSRFKASEADFTLVIQENTDPNVDGSTDDGYRIQVRIPDNMSSYQDQEFRIEGVLPEFQDLWLDGEKLVLGTDYGAENGSTKATIYAKTFENAGSGKHTLAAEFRVDGSLDKQLKKAAQNYTVGTASRTPSRTPQTQVPTGVHVPNGSIMLDTANYIMAPGNRYDIGTFLKDDKGNSLSGTQVRYMVASGQLKVQDSRTGSIVTLRQLSNGNFRVTGRQPGTAYILYEIGNVKRTVRIDVQRGVRQHGQAVRDNSSFAQ